MIIERSLEHVTLKVMLLEVMFWHNSSLSSTTSLKC